MNRKAQIGLGSILVVFITVIVGLTLFLTIAQTVGTSTSTTTVNESIALVVNDTAQYITGYRTIDDLVIYNETGGIIAAGNYTATNEFLDPTTGGLSVRIVPGSITAEYTSIWVVTGTGQGTDYINDSASRSIAGLITIFFALGVAVIIIGPVVKDGLANLG